MLALPKATSGLLSNRTYRFANCWKLTRLDGVIFRFTDHNTKLTFNGEQYVPAGGFTHTAEKKSNRSFNDALEILGMIDSSAITVNELLEGKYDSAELIHYVIDWRYPFAGAFRTSKFIVNQVTFDGEKFNAELGSLSSKLSAAVGEVYARDCRFELGDSRCQFNVATVTSTGCVVSSIQTGQLAFTATHANFSGKAAEYYGRGLLQWTSGANANRFSEVKISGAAVSTAIQFTLFEKTPYVIAVNDQFTVKAGCDKQKPTCIAKFNNVINFGGFPYLPGEDLLYRALPL